MHPLSEHKHLDVGILDTTLAVQLGNHMKDDTTLVWDGSEYEIK